MANIINNQIIALEYGINQPSVGRLYKKFRSLTSMLYVLSANYSTDQERLFISKKAAFLKNKYMKGNSP